MPESNCWAVIINDKLICFVHDANFNIPGANMYICPAFYQDPETWYVWLPEDKVIVN